MATQDWLKDIDIKKLFVILGGKIRFGYHGRPFWRETKDYNIRLYQHEGRPGIWLDTSRQDQTECFGVIGLVQLRYGYSEREAADWLEVNILHRDPTKPDVLLYDSALEAAKQWRSALIRVKQNLFAKLDQRKIYVSRWLDEEDLTPATTDEVPRLESADEEDEMEAAFLQDTLNSPVWRKWHEACQEQNRLREEIKMLRELPEADLKLLYNGQDQRNVYRAIHRADELFTEDKEFHQDMNNLLIFLADHYTQPLPMVEQEATEPMRQVA